MSFLNLVIQNMHEEMSDKFLRCLEFLKAKAAAVEEAYIALEGRSEEDICLELNKLAPHTHRNFVAYGAFSEKWMDAFRFAVYTHPEGAQPDPKYCTSPKEYEKFKERFQANASEAFAANRPSLAFHYLNGMHEVERYREEGLEACFGEYPGGRPSWNYYVDTKDPDDDYYAFQGAVILLNLGLFDRAHDYIEILKKFSQRKWRRGSSGYDPQYYLASIQFLDALLRARTTDDPEEARRHAATAIAANFQSVVDCYNTDTQQGHFHAYYPGLALCVASEFEFDVEWSHRCCRALFAYLENYRFHNLFHKATAWNAWMWKPEDHGLLPMQRVREIQEEVRRERHRKERKR